MNARRWLPIACLMGTWAPRFASADPTSADRATARALAREGQAALDRHNFALAEDRFARADALLHAPTLLLGVARAQVGRGELVEAQESYNRILREGIGPGSPAPFYRAREDAAKEVERLAPRIAWATIDVKGAADASVTLDDAPLPRAALGVGRAVNPGPHHVRAAASGYSPVETSFGASEGERTRVVVELRPAPVAEASTPSPRMSH